MRFLKRFVLIMLVLVLALIGVGYMLPDEAHVTRDIRIDAPPATVFPYVNDLRKFNEWSPWADWAPDIQYEISGPEAGVGARLSWRSDSAEVGSGSMLITGSKPPERVTARLDSGTHSDATVYFNIEAAGDGSRVVWGYDTEFGNNIIERYFGVMLELWIGGDYEQGLQNLKNLVETGGDE